MDRPPPRVAVAIVPHLVGSALSAFLELDGRLEPVLLDAADPDLLEATDGASALICSAPVEGTPPGLLVVVLSGTPFTVELRGGGLPAAEPYRGLGSLADRLADALAGNRERPTPVPGSG